MSSRVSDTISEYFQSHATGVLRTFLLVDEHPVTRNGIRKFLTDHGVAHSKVHSADNFSDAKDLIRKVRPTCILASQRFSGTPFSELIEFFFAETRLNPTETWIGCLPTLPMSNSTARLASDARVDFILPRPFTLETLGNTLKDLIQRKGDAAAAKAEFQAIYPFTSQLTQLENLGQLESAQLQAESLNKRYPHSLPVRMASDRLRFQKPYDANSADAVFQAFHSAHQAQLLHPAWVPDLLRWAVADGRAEIFDLLLGITLDLPPEENPKSLKEQLADGMTRWARSVLEKEGRTPASRSSAIEWIRKALRISEPNLATYLPLLKMLQSFGLYEEIEVLLANSPAEVRDSIESQVLYLEYLDHTRQSAALVERAQGLLNQKTRSPEIYALLVRHSRLLGRPERVVQGMIQEAESYFPNDKERFR